MRYQKAIVSRFTIWELLVHPNEEQRNFYVQHFLNELKLRDAGQLRDLFPDGKIISERVLGLSKSLVAVRA